MRDLSIKIGIMFLSLTWLTLYGEVQLIVVHVHVHCTVDCWNMNTILHLLLPIIVYLVLLSIILLSMI